MNEEEEKIQLLQRFMKSVDSDKKLRKKAILQSLKNGEKQILCNKQ